VSTMNGPTGGSGRGSASAYAGRPDRPVFVGACPRSGTTLLRTMLHNHPSLAMPRETRFALVAWDRRAAFGDLADPANRQGFVDWLMGMKRSGVRRITRDRALLSARLLAAPPTLGSLVGTCFALFAEQHGVSRWGDKRPIYAQHLRAIYSMFPDAQFVNVIRDPRGAVASIRKVGWFGGDVAKGVELWSRSVAAVDARRSRLAADQMYEIRYEDLVAEPEDQLERLAGFLGLDPSGVASMMRFHERPDVPSQRYHPLLSSPVSTTATRTWESVLAPEEVALVEKVCAGAMRRYGYEPVAGGAAAPEDLRRRFVEARRRARRVQLRRTLSLARTQLTYRHPVAAVHAAGGRSGDPS